MRFEARRARSEIRPCKNLDPNRELGSQSVWAPGVPLRPYRCGTLSRYLSQSGLHLCSDEICTIDTGYSVEESMDA